jgi:glutathione peroxidase
LKNKIYIAAAVSAVFLLIGAGAAFSAGKKGIKNKTGEKMTVYDFTVKDGDGKNVSLSAYKGKVLLIVNTATQCGLTPQYEQLQALYEKYKDKGFEILDFPSNQFLQQAPGTDAEISDFCALNYGTTFPRFAKSDVNGKGANPLFVWLKQQAPKDIENKESKAFEEKVKQYTNSADESDIKWNFGKFLINREGKVAGRFSPVFKPEDLEGEIANLL